jgi:hypothetical protein
VTRQKHVTSHLWASIGHIGIPSTVQKVIFGGTEDVVDAFAAVECVVIFIPLERRAG